MKNIFLFIFCIFISRGLYAQQKYWQQDLSYKIDVELNDTEKSLTAFETLVYKNNSPSTLDFIWFHVWPNAYSNDSTALFRQLKNDPDRKKKLEKYSYGNIEGLNFKINNQSVKTEADHLNIDIVKLLLNEPLKPGDSITISTPFKVKLPSYFSRSGFADGEFMVCQWYPKPAVYDKDGWHQFPYLDMGEFYSEYATFDVSVTLPSEYVVGATGILQTADELLQYKTIGKENRLRSNNVQLYKPGNAGRKTLSWHATNVPDFAWFADKAFVIQYDTVTLRSGTVVDAFSYYHNKKNTAWRKSIEFIKDGLLHYSEWIGEYAYPVVQAVEGPKNNASGGMEYPMITLITDPDASEQSLDGVITHEVGHNWFMAFLGTNERTHTWMDEGMNTYFQFRYEAEKYRGNSIFGKSVPQEIKRLPSNEFLDLIYKNLSEIPMESAIETPADKFHGSNDYGLTSYVKPALWLYILESSVGREKIDLAFQTYFNTWKFKHPQPADMQSSFEQALGFNLDEIFDMLKKPGKF